MSIFFQFLDFEIGENLMHVRLLKAPKVIGPSMIRVSVGSGRDQNYSIWLAKLFHI